MEPPDRTIEDYAGMIRELSADDSDQMTPWEVDFVESMAKRLVFVKPEDLSLPQQHKISQIWHRLF